MRPLAAPDLPTGARAVPTTPPSPGAGSDPDDPPAGTRAVLADLPAGTRAVLADLPGGAVGQAVAALERGLAWAGRPDDPGGWLEPAAVARQLVRPLLEVPDWPGPSRPLPVGDGAVHADLIDDDHELLARLRGILAAEGGPVDAERLAAAAQEWRLPVTPYRLRTGPPDGRPGAGLFDPDTASAAGGTASRSAGPAGIPGHHDAAPWGRPPLVVDLTSLWAGPLATSLLAALGARVVKVDPEVRPDGFRHHPDLYRSLNGAKEIVDLDLRRPADRARFEALVAEADLVVDSFSRRVMPNLGYGPAELRALSPAVATLSIVAFPAGSPEAGWVSYGPGVHAASGLAARTGPDGRVRYEPAPIAYPDALAGLEAFAVAAELLAPAGPLTGRATGPSPAPGRAASGGRAATSHREVSLAGVLFPLVARVAVSRD